mmetsp:Transcript_37985/g.41993  ORF Transcript_37985/g.41993 Transcript_37985/m.41993 type:complete len:186 (-) Transcript_37985:1197-1754(-)
MKPPNRKKLYHSNNDNENSSEEETVIESFAYEVTLSSYLQNSMCSFPSLSFRSASSVFAAWVKRMITILKKIILSNKIRLYHCDKNNDNQLKQKNNELFSRRMKLFYIVLSAGLLIFGSGIIFGYFIDNSNDRSSFQFENGNNKNVNNNLDIKNEISDGAVKDRIYRLYSSYVVFVRAILNFDLT